MKNRIYNKLKRKYNERFRRTNLMLDQPKIFCIGKNKTGTTSLKKAFEDLEFIVGNQRKAEKLLPYYKAGNFDPIIKYCMSAQVFQDFPFSYPGTFKYLDKAYPNSKFILSIRNSAEEWYYSLIKFHSKLFGKGNIPTKNDLQNASYVWKSWVWECNRVIYKTSEDDIYNKKILTDNYIQYNNAVVDYFKDRPEDLLIINLSETGSYKKFLDFLKIESPFTNFPWENKTEKIILR